MMKIEKIINMLWPRRSVRNFSYLMPNRSFLLKEGHVRQAVAPIISFG